MRAATPMETTLRHWRLTRDGEGYARLAFDKAGTATNTLSAEALAELNAALDALERDPPKGLVIASAKRSGFIAGADVDEFGDVKTEDDALALVRRGWDTFERLARVACPTVALVRGFCLGGGLELALACRYRVVVDEPGTRLGLPEVLLGIVPGWGGMKRLPDLIGAPAALDLMLTGKTVDARKAKKLGLADECVPVRVMDNAAIGILKAKPAPRGLNLALSLAQQKLCVDTSRHRRQGRLRSTPAASTIRRLMPSSTSGRATTAMRWRCRSAIRPRCRRC
jgi:3-hydroxyacyl-CoA dehydrogenase/enoyl-CoA hydratase/3-hydroxybutyryl-CoA epimerase